VKGLGMVLATVALAAATGCDQKLKVKIAELEKANAECVKTQQELRGQLAQAQARQTELEFELSSKDQQLRDKDDEIARLKSETASKTPTGTAGMGWETGLVGDKVTVGSDVLFASGRATLTANGKKVLDRIVREIKANYPGKPIRVYGYTDTDPIRKTRKLWKDNLDLSANRAMAVTRYLIGKGIPAKRIETVAMGEHHPISGSKDKSRRVEIVAIK